MIGLDHVSPLGLRLVASQLLQTLTLEAFLAPFGTPFAMPDVEFNAPRRSMPLPDGARVGRTRPDEAFLAPFGPPFVMSEGEVWFKPVGGDAEQIVAKQSE